MKEPIPIDDSMPDKLKTAINYLNESNISLTDKIDVNRNFEEDEDDEENDEDFDGYVSEEDIEETADSFDDEDISEDDDVDISDLDSIF